MSQTRKKYISRHLDDLTTEDQENINKLPEPWQKNFINRFYEQLKVQEMSKKTLCDKANKNRKQLISETYFIKETTLSQYTNYKSSCIRPPSVNALISISNGLDVSIDYLLGIESSIHHNITDIHKETGLTPLAINNIKSSPDIQEFINILLQSSKLNLLLQQLMQLFYAEYVSSDILSVYSNILKQLLLSAFDNYMKETSPIDFSPERYKYYLKMQLEVSNISINKKFIESNVLSKDRLEQIIYMKKVQNITLSSAFLEDTVSCVYNILSYANTVNYYRNKLSNLFLEITDEFFVFKKNSLKKELKEAITHTYKQ